MRVLLELFSKKGMLFLVQVDHLSGEVLGNVIDCFYEAGAKNVQIISSITKKNRPSYIILIDTAGENAEKIEYAIVNECGSSGWHRIETCHRHTRVSIIPKAIKVRTEKGLYDFTVRGKVINDDLTAVRPEYDDCAQLKALLKEKEDRNLSLKQIQMELTELFHSDSREIRV